MIEAANPIRCVPKPVPKHEHRNVCTAAGVGPACTTRGAGASCGSVAPAVVAAALP